jgi:hypothetical protein
MAFIEKPGVIGKIFVPDKKSGATKKHPCPECHACQQCGDDRCRICRPENTLKKKPHSTPKK